jgi:hypothetical protein
MLGVKRGQVTAGPAGNHGCDVIGVRLAREKMIGIIEGDETLRMLRQAENTSRVIYTYDFISR